MNQYTWAGPVGAVLVIAVGCLICFWGYRIVKLTLAIVGFIAGAFGGLEAASYLGQNSTSIQLVCAVIGGLIGAGLCLGLYYLGIFLLGASAGAVLASAFFHGAGQQPNPLFVLALAVVFGVVALLAQKFMIVISTAFSGAYLIIAGAWPFVAPGQSPSRVWLHPSEAGPPGVPGYAALAVWLLLAIVGASFQFRRRRRTVEVEVKK